MADIVKSASYSLLKTELIKRLSVSETAKLDHLLAGLTPSQLRREMRKLSGSKIDDDLMKSLWLRRLPESTQAVLACVSGFLEALASAANKMHELHARPTIAAVQQPSNELGELKREMAVFVASMADAGRSAFGRQVASSLAVYCEKVDRVAGRQDNPRTDAFVGIIVDSARKLPDVRSHVNSRLTQKTRSAGGPGGGHPERSATSPNNL